MKIWVAAILCVLMAYLIGTFNPAYIVARIKGFDIRKTGSGNAGASNAAITMGAKWGVISALIDIAKAFFAVKLSVFLLSEHLPYAFEIASASCILGHMFPVFMGFRGGKGLACLGGVIIAFDWRVTLIMLAAELVLVFATDYICFVAISASIALPVTYGIMEKTVIGALILSLASIAILYKHAHNILRIRNGTEAHFSGLWRRDAEVARVLRNGKQGAENDVPDPAPSDFIRRE